VKRYRRLRRLEPDAELVRRRAAGETFREIAPDYRVSHTTLSRYCARPEVATQVTQAGRLLRAEQRAAAASWQAEQKARRDTGRLARQRQAAREQATAGLVRIVRLDGSSQRHVAPAKAVQLVATGAWRRG